ncbi:phosphopantetheine-binding protein, partial [Pseudoalteromonas denitrificans]
TDTEKALVNIWSGLLNLEADKISTTANFFELGGHSILVIKLLQLINSHFELQFELMDLYSKENIKTFAQYVELVTTLHSKSVIINESNEEFEDFEL